MKRVQQVAMTTRSYRKPLLTVLSMALLGLGTVQTAFAADDDGVRRVNQVTWDKTGSVYQPVSTYSIATNEANLVFIRPLDADTLQTSANIGIDGEFQVSLQGGHYSQVMECAGPHRISVTTTGIKNNELGNSSGQRINLTPQQTYYFYVEVDDSTNQPKISLVSEESALNVLGNKTEQTHQISRVTADCKTPAPVVVVDTPPPVVAVAPVVAVEPVVAVAQPEPAVVLDQPIALDVLFKFDSDEVQPVYNQRIQDVAGFMARYPNTYARIEGHTDSVGAASYNMGLSERRAKAVRDELVGMYGADSSRVTTLGFGETRPVASNSTAQGRQKNRRVVAIISQR